MTTEELLQAIEEYNKLFKDAYTAMELNRQGQEAMRLAEWAMWQPGLSFDVKTDNTTRGDIRA